MKKFSELHDISQNYRTVITTGGNLYIPSGMGAVDAVFERTEGGDLHITIQCTDGEYKRYKPIPKDITRGILRYEATIHLILFSMGNGKFMAVVESNI